jgi:hypothetical protein
MRAPDLSRGPFRRRYCPALEGLEVRELLSAAPATARELVRHRTNGLDLNLAVATTGNQAGDSRMMNRSLLAGSHPRANPPWVNEKLLQSLAAELYSPITTTQPIKIGNQVFPPGTYAVPQPNAAEVQRQTFWAEFVGTYYVAPPRFSNQAATIHIYSNGDDMTSNQFLKGRGQVLLFPPADPSASPTNLDPVAGKVTGMVTVYPNNVLQSSATLFLNAINLPGVASNDPQALDHGLPSHLQLLLDINGVNGGLYSTALFATTPATQTNADTGQPIPMAQGGAGGAVAFAQGAGFLDLKYSPAVRSAGRVKSGTVLVRMQGIINLTGVANPLYKGIN